MLRNYLIYYNNIVYNLLDKCIPNHIDTETPLKREVIVSKTLGPTINLPTKAFTLIMIII